MYIDVCKCGKSINEKVNGGSFWKDNVCWKKREKVEN